jgi:hypothetical protein
MRYACFLFHEHIEVKLVLPPGTDHRAEGVVFDSSAADVDLHTLFQDLLNTVRAAEKKSVEGAS